MEAKTITTNQLFLLKKEMDDLIDLIKQHKDLKDNNAFLSYHKLKIRSDFLDMILEKGFSKTLDHYTDAKKKIITEARLRRELENTTGL
jgi:hypothetical protein